MSVSLSLIMHSSQSLDALVQRIDPHNEEAALEKVLIRSIDSPSEQFEVKSKGILAKIGRFFTRLLSSSKPKPYDLEANLKCLSALFDDATAHGSSESREARHERLNAFADKIELIRDKAVVSLSKKGEKNSDRINRLK